MGKKVLKRKIFELKDERHEKMLKYLVAISYHGCRTETAALRIILDIVCDNPWLLDDGTDKIEHAENFEKFCSIDS